MSGTSDKIEGLANKAAGAVKQGVGHAVGNPKLEAEGTAQKLHGETQEAVGKAEDAIDNAKSSVKSALKAAVNKT